MLVMMWLCILTGDLLLVSMFFFCPLPLSMIRFLCEIGPWSWYFVKHFKNNKLSVLWMGCNYIKNRPRNFAPLFLAWLSADCTISPRQSFQLKINQHFHALMNTFEKLPDYENCSYWFIEILNNSLIVVKNLPGCRRQMLAALPRKHFQGALLIHLKTQHNYTWHIPVVMGHL